MAVSWAFRASSLLLALATAIAPAQAQSQQQPSSRQTGFGDKLPQLQDGAFAPSTAPQTPPFRIEGNRSIYTAEEVEQAIAAFRASCQPLGGEQWDDLNNITARITPEYAPYRREKGWKTAIHLTATISQKPRIIPASDRKMGGIAGRTLYFFIGGGHVPGVFVSRQVGQFLCGLPGYQTGDVEFIPIPELEFLNR